MGLKFMEFLLTKKKSAGDGGGGLHNDGKVVLKAALKCTHRNGRKRQILSHVVWQLKKVLMIMLTWKPR